jgi:formylglycine-generating enzyme required for sulfatase activity
MLLIISLIILLLNTDSYTQVRQYRAYRAVKKKKTLLMPVRSSTLNIPIRKMLDENFISEMVKPGSFDVINRYPDFDLEMSMGMTLADFDLYRIADKTELEVILIPTIEKDGDSYKTTVVMHDVRRLFSPTTYTNECPCAFEDVVFMVIPEAAEALSNAKFEPEACPPGMIKLDPTNFTMGSDDKYDNNPISDARVASFCIDPFEYPGKLGKEPVTDITWQKADSTCRSEGKRLCTEQEWEFACRGQNNFVYPYGNLYLPASCNTEGKKIEPTGSKLNCKTESNIYDLSGNVNEWTASNWDGNLRSKVIRGGAYISEGRDSKCTLRFSNRPETTARTIGFRCCKTSP